MNEISGKTSTSESILQVKSFLASFLSALKNYALYPEGHSINQQSLLNAAENLDRYLVQHEFLRLYVEEKKLIFNDQVLQHEEPEEQVLVYPLFRDGIQWIEFQNGLTTEELQKILYLLNKHRVIKEEAEDDLVTTMWEAEFPHFQYQVDDEVWASDSIIDFSGFKAGHGLSCETTEEFTEPVTQLKKFNIPMPESDFLKLSFTEENRLKALIREEETRNTTQDCLDILVIILREQPTEEHCLSVLDFLVGEIQYALSQCEFTYIRGFFESITALSKSPMPDRPWFKSLLTDFWYKIATTEVLDVLEPVWPRVNTINDSQMTDLHDALLMLPPESLSVLSSMLSKVTNPRIENMLIEVIAVQASRGVTDLEELINGIKPRLVRNFLILLSSLEVQGINKVLFNLTKHLSVEIRECAINILIERDPQHIRPLFSLIEDHQQRIRHLLFKHLGKQRNQTCERLLMAYLEKNQIRINDREHIIDCYSALGRCATTASIPFLQDMLFKRDLTAFVGIAVNPHRQGAAVALMLMQKLWNTEELLNRASRSFFYGIRLAYRMAEKEILKMKKRI